MFLSTESNKFEQQATAEQKSVFGQEELWQLPGNRSCLAQKSNGFMIETGLRGQHHENNDLSNQLPYQQQKNCIFISSERAGIHNPNPQCLCLLEIHCHFYHVNSAAQSTQELHISPFCLFGLQGDFFCCNIFLLQVTTEIKQSV